MRTKVGKRPVSVNSKRHGNKPTSGSWPPRQAHRPLPRGSPHSYFLGGERSGRDTACGPSEASGARGQAPCPLGVFFPLPPNTHTRADRHTGRQTHTHRHTHPPPPHTHRQADRQTHTYTHTHGHTDTHTHPPNTQTGRQTHTQTHTRPVCDGIAANTGPVHPETVSRADTRHQGAPRSSHGRAQAGLGHFSALPVRQCQNPLIFLACLFPLIMSW